MERYIPGAMKKNEYSDHNTHKHKKKDHDQNHQAFGKDDGRGASKTLHFYLDEVLARDRTHEHDKVSKTPSVPFQDLSFEKQCEDIENNSDLLLSSQKAYIKSRICTHTSKQRLNITNLAKRLHRNDGVFVICRLNSEGLDDAMLALIAQAMPYNKSLHSLMLHDNGITDVGVHKLCRGCRWHPELRTIWLGGNRLTDVAVDSICDLLTKNPHIREINISNKWPKKRRSLLEQEMHAHITVKGVLAFASQLRCTERYCEEGMKTVGMCPLLSLSLANQRATDVGAKGIFESLPYCRLRTLNLKGNHLTDECCEMLMLAMGDKNIRLELLNLSKNEITDKGALLIADGFTRNASMNSFDISNNLIDKVGLQAFVDCLSHNRTLTSLITINNLCVEDNRAEVIAAARGVAKNNVQYHHDRCATTPQRMGSAHKEELNALQNLATPLKREPSTASLTGQSIPEDGLGVVARAPSREVFSPIRANVNDQDSAHQQTWGDGIGVSGSRPASMYRRSGSSTNLLTSLSVNEGDEKDAGGLRIITPMSTQLSATNLFKAEKGLQSDGAHHLIDSFGSNKSGQLDMKVLKQPSDIGERRVQEEEFFVPNGRRSAELGKGLTIPDFGHSGIMPIRTNISKNRDSGVHLMYLRVAGADDYLADERPNSIINIAKTYKDEREKLMEARQMEGYMMEKQLRLKEVSKKPQKAAMKPAPAYFWDAYKKKMQLVYDNGIDRTKGCTSTKYNSKDAKHIHYDMTPEEKGAIYRENKLLKAAESPGQVLAIRRSLIDEKIKEKELMEKAEKAKSDYVPKLSDYVPREKAVVDKLPFSAEVEGGAGNGGSVPAISSLSSVIPPPLPAPNILPQLSPVKTSQVRHQNCMYCPVQSDVYDFQSPNTVVKPVKKKTNIKTSESAHVVRDMIGLAKHQNVSDVNNKQGLTRHVVTVEAVEGAS